MYRLNSSFPPAPFQIPFTWLSPFKSCPPSCCISTDKEQERSSSHYERKTRTFLQYQKLMVSQPPSCDEMHKEQEPNSRSIRLHSKRQNMLWGDLANDRAVLIMRSVFQGDYEQLLQTHLPKSTGMQLQTFSPALQSSSGLALSCVFIWLWVSSKQGTASLDLPFLFDRITKFKWNSTPVLRSLPLGTISQYL